jgi:RNA polymerase sigma-70 factor, ECF subfamily
MQQTLVERAQAGDHDAFTVLIRAAYPRLYGIANLILRDSDRAQDAVQDALVLAWDHIRALRQADAWDGWLYRLTVRACHRRARRDRRRRLLEVPPIPEMDPRAPFDLARSVVDRDQIDHALALVTVDQRVVLVLHFYVGLRLADVAAVLGVPVGTAKSRLNRGLTSLRETLGEASGEPAGGRRRRPA